MAKLPTWICPQCTLENEASKDFCTVCNSHKHAKTDGTGGEVEFVKGKSGLLSLPFFKKSMKWCCPRCRTTHELDSFQCDYCAFIRTNEPQEGARTASPRTKTRSLMKRVFGSDSDLSGGSFEEPMDGSWSCAKCTFANHPSNTVCEACGSKPKSTSLHSNRSTRSEYSGGRRKAFRQSQSHDPGAHVDPYGSSGTALHTEETQLWVCPACTTINKTDFRTCQVCQSGSQESAKVDPRARRTLDAPALLETGFQPASELPFAGDFTRQRSDSSHSGLNDLSRMSSHSSEGLVEWNNLSRMSSSQSQEGSSSSSGKKSSRSRFTGWNDLYRTSTDSDPGTRLTSPPSSNSPLVHANIATCQNPLSPDAPFSLHRQRSHTKTVLQVRLEEEGRAWQTYHEITEHYRKVRKHKFTHRSVVLMQHVKNDFCNLYIHCVVIHHINAKGLLVV